MNKTCYNCGAIGHTKAACPNPRAKFCKTCKNYGHQFNECTNSHLWPCRKCGLVGHETRACTSKGSFLPFSTSYEGKENTSQPQKKQPNVATGDAEQWADPSSALITIEEDEGLHEDLTVLEQAQMLLATAEAEEAQLVAATAESLEFGTGQENVSGEVDSATGNAMGGDSGEGNDNALLVSKLRWEEAKQAAVGEVLAYEVLGFKVWMATEVETIHVVRSHAVTRQ